MNKSYIKAKKGDVVTFYSFKTFSTYDKVAAVVADIRYITYGGLKVQLFTLKKDGETFTHPHWSII